MSEKTNKSHFEYLICTDGIDQFVNILRSDIRLSSKKNDVFKIKCEANLNSLRINSEIYQINSLPDYVEREDEFLKISKQTDPKLVVTCVGQATTIFEITIEDDIELSSSEFDIDQICSSEPIHINIMNPENGETICQLKENKNCSDHEIHINDHQVINFKRYQNYLIKCETEFSESTVLVKILDIESMKSTSSGIIAAVVIIIVVIFIALLYYFIKRKQ